MKKTKRELSYVYDTLTIHLKNLNDLIESGEMKAHQLNRLKPYRITLRKRIKKLESILHFECVGDYTELNIMEGK